MCAIAVTKILTYIFLNEISSHKRLNCAAFVQYQTFNALSAQREEQNALETWSRAHAPECTHLRFYIFRTT